MNLCFDEAYQALSQRRITDAEYLHEALSHFCGVRHPPDAASSRPWESMVNDPVGNAIREAALQSPQSSPESLPLLERLFASARTDDVSNAQKAMTQLQSKPGQKPPIQALATLAAFHGSARVLGLCLKLGASLEEKDTLMALEFAARGPALLDLLYQEDWRGMRTSRLAFDRMAVWALQTSPQELCWFLDHGASISRDIFRHAAHGSFPKVACVQVLLDRYGTALLRGTRLLQRAAKCGRNDVVRLLLDTGMDVDELVVRSSHDDGEVEATALYEAVYRQHLDTVGLLLAHGADPEKQVSSEGWNTPMKLAEGHHQVDMVALLRSCPRKSKL